MDSGNLKPTLSPALDEDCKREPAKEEIMEDIIIGIIEAKAGEGMPAREAFQALRQRIYGDGEQHDTSQKFQQ